MWALISERGGCCNCGDGEVVEVGEVDGEKVGMGEVERRCCTMLSEFLTCRRAKGKKMSQNFREHKQVVKVKYIYKGQ